MPAMLMEHSVDPKKEIWDKIGDLSKVRVMGNYVLIGVYQRPKMTKSGIHLADVTIKEDEHQGKAGLVLKLGPKAYKSDANYEFEPEEIVNIGDWITIFVSDGRKVVVNGYLCRLVQDQHIRMAVPTPDMVF